MCREREGLRVALLAYRGNPHSGGQGVYTRHLSRELAALGHRVTVFAGPPYPETDLAHARTLRRRLTLRRWYGFLGMQKQVAALLPRIITVSSSSAADIVAQMGVDAAKVRVVPVGVDTRRFRPLPGVARVPGRI